MQTHAVRKCGRGRPKRAQERSRGRPWRRHAGPRSAEVREGSLKSSFGRSKKGKSVEAVNKIKLLVVH